ncbi:esterase [Bryobacter aggregatus]|uniref:esterase n=1 Tax=Bryobacter aggregatus TaxID=360054 RepID=UPI0006905F1F|nr:alpha/beta hydrolase-fold protein [Bryobacter aggregatus]
MTRRLLAAALFGFTAFAQAPPPLLSPEVTKDRHVTFRLRARTAEKVDLLLEGSPRQPMSKSDDGVWSLTVGPLAPDIYGYTFSIDGTNFLDPATGEIKTNALSPNSMVLVPGDTPEAWEQTKVPHGTVHHHFFASAIAGDQRDFFVYTPPGYQPSKRYPLLVLLHGMSDKADAWTTVGKANLIFDNLLAAGKIRPMIVVMPLGYGAPIDSLRTGLPRDPAIWGKNAENFARTLLEEVLPQAEQIYKLAKDRKHRAITGLSMGGSESLLIGLNHLDQFAYVGAFSGGGITPNAKPEDRYPKLLSDTKNRPSLLWLAAGSSDQAHAPMIRLSEWLKSKQIDNTWVSTPGAHNWLVWRRYLTTYSTLLWK